MLESRVIDESSEWRTFSDSDKGGADPEPHGGPHEPHAERRRLGTSIGKNPDGTYNQTLTRLHNAGRNPDRPMLAAFGKINELADHLGMTNVVKDGACDIFRMVVKPGQPMLGKSLNAMYAACLYISCRQEGTNRTFKEICGGATGTTVKEIGKCYKHVVKAIDGLNTQMMEQMITPEKLVNRFCGNLGLANLEFLKLATAVVGAFRALRDSEGHTGEASASRRRGGGAVPVRAAVRGRGGGGGGHREDRRGFRDGGGDYPRELRGHVLLRGAHAPRGVQNESGETAGAGTEQRGARCAEAGLDADALGGLLLPPI